MPKIETPRYEYKVVVRDNFHYMDRGAHYELGTFATYEAALAARREIVDGSFRADWADDVTADEMFSSYAMFGDARLNCSFLPRSERPSPPA